MKPAETQVPLLDEPLFYNRTKNCSYIHPGKCFSNPVHDFSPKAGVHCLKVRIIIQRHLQRSHNAFPGYLYPDKIRTYVKIPLNCNPIMRWT